MRVNEETTDSVPSGYIRGCRSQKRDEFTRATVVLRRAVASLRSLFGLTPPRLAVRSVGDSSQAIMFAAAIGVAVAKSSGNMNGILAGSAVEPGRRSV